MEPSTDNGDGTVNGQLLGTTLRNGEIDKPLRNLTYTDGAFSWTFPNVDPWRFNGSIDDNGELQGSTGSAQGTVPLTFRPASR